MSNLILYESPVPWKTQCTEHSKNQDQTTVALVKNDCPDPPMNHLTQGSLSLECLHSAELLPHGTTGVVLKGFGTLLFLYGPNAIQIRGCHMCIDCDSINTPDENPDHLQLNKRLNQKEEWEIKRFEPLTSKEVSVKMERKLKEKQKKDLA
ncbi:hypothetical protein BTVI_10897 [Pitangus sulphuratus]|nr:hypothetical protein BTVI_10897 [Pitangus sulphuratus]